MTAERGLGLAQESRLGIPFALVPGMERMMRNLAYLVPLVTVLFVMALTNPSEAGEDLPEITMLKMLAQQARAQGKMGEEDFQLVLQLSGRESGAVYYANGKLAGESGYSWFWPNDHLAGSRQLPWFYPDASPAGSAAALNLASSPALYHFFHPSGR
jgi:hypothetical protein